MSKKWICLTMIVLMEILLGVFFFAWNGETKDTQVVIYASLAVGMLLSGLVGMFRSLLSLEIAQTIPSGIAAGVCWVLQLAASIFLLLGNFSLKTCILTEIGCITFIIFVVAAVYRVVSSE